MTTETMYIEAFTKYVRQFIRASREEEDIYTPFGGAVHIHPRMYYTQKPKRGLGFKLVFLTDPKIVLVEGRCTNPKQPSVIKIRRRKFKGRNQDGKQIGSEQLRQRGRLIDVEGW